MYNSSFGVLIETYNLINQSNGSIELYNDAYSTLRSKYNDCCTDINAKINTHQTIHRTLIDEYNKTIKPGMLVQTHIHNMNKLKQNIQHNLNEGFKLYELIENRHSRLDNTPQSDIQDIISNINSSPSFGLVFDLPPTGCLTRLCI